MGQNLFLEETVSILSGPRGTVREQSLQERASSVSSEQIPDVAGKHHIRGMTGLLSDLQF